MSLESNERSAQSENVSPLSRKGGNVQKSISLRREVSCRIKLFNDEEAQLPSPELTIPPSNKESKERTPIPYNRKRVRDDAGRAVSYYYEDELPNKKPQRSLVEDYYEEMEVDYENAIAVENTEREGNFIDDLFKDVTRNPSNFAKPRASLWGKTKSFTVRRKTDSSLNTMMEMEEDEGWEAERNEASIYDKSHLTVDYHLKAVETADSTCFRQIDSEDLKNLLLSHTEASFNAKYILIDCRYPFEYRGGHIKYATNFFDPNNIAELFYNEDDTVKHRRIPIFYCEFSQKRGPSMAEALREYDRYVHRNNYPNVSFPEMYVLHKGYRQFFKVGRTINRSLCFPDRYVEMYNDRFTNELKLYPFHKSGRIGQSVLRMNSAPVNLVSSRNNPRHQSTSNKPSTIPEGGEGEMSPAKGPAPQSRQITKTPSQRGGIDKNNRVVRSLFSENTDSPTSEQIKTSIREQQQKQQRQPQQDDVNEEEDLGREMGHLVVAESAPQTPTTSLQFNEENSPT
ncbi:hypothetical protein CAEBREN_09297 [Caenorhabditis brenneri]|uniref:M-phase inducer phosphatase n=1 Tax=Caenorhabditis brenneri TaxID=135651 RepID=G0M954_CAEBE|nr:hypothetical protein CAEBREN_09297 [Caenorhabditis brenneri]